MFLIDKAKNRIKEIDSKAFSQLGIKERENLQEWIVNTPTFFGEEMLIIQKEFDGFDDTKERLDILALDKFGDIVVIENKLDDTGRDVMWQVLKYASYCASLSKVQIRTIYQQYLDKQRISEDAESKITDFFEVSDFAELELNKSQRIIMVSAHFRKEVTSTVLWLLNNYKLKIQCFKTTPYTMDNQLFLNVEQIIPVKEVEDYMIRMADKKKEDSDTQEELKSRNKIREKFWQNILDKYNRTESKLFENINPSKDNWITAGVGMSGLGLNFVISKTHGRTELFISRGVFEENKYIFDQLYAQKEHIETIFGGELVWERMDKKKSSRIRYELYDVNCYNEEDWDKMMSFMIDGMLRMEKALIKPIRTINQKLKRKGSPKV